MSKFLEGVERHTPNENEGKNNFTVTLTDPVGEIVNQFKMSGSDFAFDNFQAGGSVHQANWGNPAYTGTDQADVNGYGSFEYSPSAGTFDSVSKDFLALCTKNLAESG